MYKGKFLNNGSVPKAAAPAPEEVSSEELLQQTLEEHKQEPANEPFPKNLLPRRKSPVKARLFSTAFTLYL